MGQKLSLREQIRKNERAINRAIRDIDRERVKMEREQKKIEKDIKDLAKKGQHKAARTNAKMLVRNRNQVKKMYEMKAHLLGVKTEILNMKSTHAMTSAMKNTSQAMMRMNQTMKIPQMQKVMKDFMKEQEKMGVIGETMGDMIDDATGNGLDEEEEISAEIGKILDEIGLEATENLPSAGADVIASATTAQTTKNVKTAAPVGVSSSTSGGAGAPQAHRPTENTDDAETGGADVDDLQARLDNLRR